MYSGIKLQNCFQSCVVFFGLGFINYVGIYLFYNDFYHGESKANILSPVRIRKAEEEEKWRAKANNREQ